MHQETDRVDKDCARDHSWPVACDLSDVGGAERVPHEDSLLDGGEELGLGGHVGHAALRNEGELDDEYLPSERLHLRDELRVRNRADADAVYENYGRQHRSRSRSRARLTSASSSSRAVHLQNRRLCLRHSHCWRRARRGGGRARSARRKRPGRAQELRRLGHGRHAVRIEAGSSTGHHAARYELGGGCGGFQERRRGRGRLRLGVVEAEAPRSLELVEAHRA
mmetsp:Transcript_28213/g.64827  ORF Transcript_28213/g.64827 Transcript_28213/m.64827 type:complete len:223 (+) Transcript_28213:1615-2283(+)